MPQVPYSGAPSVPLQENPTPTMHYDTPVAAFGGATAAAEQNVGRSISGAGDELFTRAQAMQDLFNHSQALEADTRYMQAAGDIHAKLSSLQGKDAVDYFTNGYHQDLQSARQSIRDSLPNDMAQKIYDQSSLSTYGRTVFNGAGYAATQNKNYAIGAAAAKVQGERNAALQAPENDEQFQSHLDSTKNEVTAQYSLKGADPATIDNAVQNAQSGLWYDRIASLARTQPYTAQKLLDKASKAGQINGEDLGKITNIVQSAMHSVGSRQIANAVMSGSDLSYGAKPVPIESAKLAIGTFESQNNYQSVGVQTAHGRALGRYQIMEENLPDWLKQSGLPPMSSADFLKSPSAQDKVFETIFGNYMAKTGSFNDAASMWFSGRTPDKAGNARDALGTSVPQYLAGTNRVLAQNSPLPDQVAKARTMADAQSPNDPLLADYAERQVYSQYSLNKQAQVSSNYYNKQTIDGAILQGNNGKPFANIDELKQFNPEAEAAYMNLPPQKQLQVQKDIQSYNTAATRITNRDAANKLQGLAYGSPEDVDKFINTNIYQEPLNHTDMNRLISLQNKLVKDRGGNVQIRQALAMVEPLLSAENVNTKDKDLMAKFRGSYIDAIQDWHANNPNKPLDQKTAKQLAAGIIQQQTSPNFWYGTDYLFNLPLPDDFKNRWIKAHPDATPAQLELVRQEYVRQQFNSLQKSKSKSSIDNQSSGPSVPVSQ